MYLLPGPGGVGLACRVNSILELSEVHKGGGQTGKVGDVVEKQLGSFVHLLFIAPLSNLGGAEGEREGGKEGRKEGGREEGRERREGGREGGRKRGRKRGREEEREGGREGGRKEGREEEREGGREGGRKGGRKITHHNTQPAYNSTQHAHSQTCRDHLLFP